LKPKPNYKDQLVNAVQGNNPCFFCENHMKLILFWCSDYGGETDVSLNCCRFYGPIVRPRMRMNDCMMSERTIFFNFRKMWIPRWIYIDKEKPKDSEKNLSQCHFVHHKSHWTDLGAKPGRRGERPETNRLSHGTALNTLCGQNAELLTVKAGGTYCYHWVIKA
jgi:hypothetical protein